MLLYNDDSNYTFFFFLLKINAHLCIYMRREHTRCSRLDLTPGKII